MSTDNPTAEPEASIESRIAATFSREADEAPEVAAPEAEQTPEDDTTTDQTEEVVDEGVDFETDDGEVIKVPSAAKDALLRQADYSRKTEQLAQLQAQATDRLQYAEAREQLAAAVIEDVAGLRALQSELSKFQRADWRALYDASPGQAFEFQQQMRDLERQVAEKQATIQEKASHVQRVTAEHAKAQWSMALQGARKLIGNVTESEIRAMAQTMRTLGISEAELETRFAHPGVIAAVHKAAKWDALQSGKPQALETANKAPPVVKPGAVNHNAAADNKYRGAREKLRKSGNIHDAASLLLMRGFK